LRPTGVTPDPNPELADAIVLRDQVMLLAVGVVGFDRRSGVEVGQQSRLPLRSGVVEHVAQDHA
jgi:hypothetical protein